MTALWNNIIADTSSSSFPDKMKLLGIFAESMEPTFSHTGDAMPEKTFGYRQKYIHTVGAVGKVKFVA